MRSCVVVVRRPGAPEKPRIHATCRLETGDDSRRAPDAIAGEECCGTFVALAAETAEQRELSWPLENLGPCLPTLTQTSAPAMPDDLLLALCVDDFTGCTDVLEVMANTGLPSALFLQPPGPEVLARFGGLRCVGVAGTARARDTAWLDLHPPTVIEQLAAPSLCPCWQPSAQAVRR